MTWKAHSGAE